MKNKTLEHCVRQDDCAQIGGNTIYYERVRDSLTKMRKIRVGEQKQATHRQR